MNDLTPIDRNPAPTNWSEALLMDLALGTPEDVILDVYDMQAHQLHALLAHPAFKLQLAAMKVEVQKSGVTFEAKAKAQADALLDTSWALIHDRATPANVKADLIKSTVRWAGHEKQAGDEKNGGRSGFQININLGGINPAANGVTIEGNQT